MVNNFEQIKALLEFRSEDDFYFLQIIKRRKENSDISSNNVIVKTYSISSIEYLNQKYTEIIDLCIAHNARAYINLNRRSHQKIAFHMLKKVTDQIMNGAYDKVKNSYESVCGLYNNETERKWIVDIDDPDAIKNGTLDKMISLLDDIMEPSIRKTICLIETKNGFHLITRKFNTREFLNVFPDVDIHKDNPTILYIP